MIGIIAAMECEMNEIKNSMSDVKEEIISSLTFYIGKLKSRDVVLVKCGEGKVNAAISTEAMILKFNPKIIINTGVAGGLGKDVKIFDIVIANKLCQHDVDVTPLGFKLGQVPSFDDVYFYADETKVDFVAKKAEKIGCNAHIGIIASGEQFISTNEKKNHIVTNFDAIACEMEGGAIAQVCAQNSTKFLVIRAISDGGNDDAQVDFPTFCNKAATNAMKLIDEIIEEI